jgi:hypothetical protein
MKKAEKHYEQWSLEECTTFINLYLRDIRRRDAKEVRRSIALELKRTFSSIDIRTKEVAKILSGSTNPYPHLTPNMVEAVENTLKQGTITKQKMLFLFE